MIIRKKCRICEGRLIKIISLNKICLVGNFLKLKKKQKRYPISLNYCNKCFHIQIAEIISPKKLFSNYLWETGISKSNYDIFRDIAFQYKSKINKKTKVFEIASNDGSFLKFLRKKFSCMTVGIDPAANFLNKTNKITQINGFFDYKKSYQIIKKFGQFDLIFARNVLAHVINPNEIFRGIRNLLKINGCAVIEVPHLLPIIKNLQYDNIFHEHNGFHSIKSIKDLCDKNELYLSNVIKIKSQGGSIRCEIKRIDNIKNKSKILNFIKEEKKAKLFNKNFLLSYKFKIISHKVKLIDLLKSLKAKKYKISIYGASGKGQALIQFNNISNKLVDKVYDKSKMKINKYTPGSNLYIEKSSNIKRKNIDYLFLSSWNLKNEIIKQEKIFLKSGGRFIVPFPEPKVIK